MDNENWRAFVWHLVEAKRSLGRAYVLLERAHGPAPGADGAFATCADAIDMIYDVESRHPRNADVVAPADVQEFWNYTHRLPGFAIGSVD